MVEEIAESLIKFGFICSTIDKNETVFISNSKINIKHKTSDNDIFYLFPVQDKIEIWADKKTDVVTLRVFQHETEMLYLRNTISVQDGKIFIGENYLFKP